MEVAGRTLAQNAKFSAIVSDIARQCPLIPYRRAFFVEAWKRYLLALFVRDARLSAFYEGKPDPFPVRPVPSSSLSSEQAGELIEFCQCWAAENDVELRK